MSLSRSRLSALVTLTALGLALVATPARADDPPAAPAPAYAPLPDGDPLGYGAPARPAWESPRPAPEYPAPMEHRSPYLMMTGVLLISFGTIGAVAGTMMVATPKRNDIIIEPSCPDCAGGGLGGSGTTVDTGNPAFHKAGIGALVGGLVAVAAGIPLLAIGAKRVPIGPAKAAALVPVVSATPGGATITLRF